MNNPEVTMHERQNRNSFDALDKATTAAGIAISLAMRVPAALKPIQEACIRVSWIQLPHRVSSGLRAKEIQGDDHLPSRFLNPPLGSPTIIFRVDQPNGDADPTQMRWLCESLRRMVLASFAFYPCDVCDEIRVPFAMLR